MSNRHHSPVTTKAFVRGFSETCIKHGVDAKTSAELLRQAHMRDMMRNDPHFRAGVASFVKSAGLGDMWGSLVGNSSPIDPDSSYTPLGKGFSSFLPSASTGLGARAKLPGPLAESRASIKGFDKSISGLQRRLAKPEVTPGEHAGMRATLDDYQRSLRDTFRTTHQQFRAVDNERSSLTSQMGNVRDEIAPWETIVNDTTKNKGSLRGTAMFGSSIFPTWNPDPEGRHPWYDQFAWTPQGRYEAATDNMPLLQSGYRDLAAQLAKLKGI